MIPWNALIQSGKLIIRIMIESECSAVVETDYACGRALFVKAVLLNKIGLFDEKFFLTFEETDLCYGARRAGYGSYFVPDAKVWHKVSTAFGGENSALFDMKINVLIMTFPHSARIGVAAGVLTHLMRVRMEFLTARYLSDPEGAT